MNNRENKTYRVRDSVLKAYYHLRALIKIESDENESFILETIINEGYNEIVRLEKEKKDIFINPGNSERYNIGGLIELDLHDKIKYYAKKYGWKVQEAAEICIYLCCLKKMSKKEQKFFAIENWRIVIVGNYQN